MNKAKNPERLIDSINLSRRVQETPQGQPRSAPPEQKLNHQLNQEK